MKDCKSDTEKFLQALMNLTLLKNLLNPETSFQTATLYLVAKNEKANRTIGEEVEENIFEEIIDILDIF